MTPMKLKAIDFIRGRLVRAGISPSGQEIADELGVGRSTAFHLIDGLVAEGLLTRRAGAARSLRLPDVPDLRTVDSELLRAELARRGEEIGAFAVPQRRAFGRRDKPCAAEGCNVAVRVGHAFCLEHWRAISADTQRDLLHAHRVARMNGHDFDGTFQAMFAQARDEATTRQIGERH